MTPVQHQHQLSNTFLLHLMTPSAHQQVLESTVISQVIGSSLPWTSLLRPFTSKVHQEQIAEEPGSFEGTQQCAVEHILHVLLPQIQEQFLESVQEIPQELLFEPIEEPVVNAPIPHSVVLIEDIPVPQGQLIAEETTLNTSSTSTSSATPSVPSATPVPVIVHLSPVLQSSLRWNLFQNVIHEKQMEVDRCVFVFKREKEKLRLLEDCSCVPPHDLEVLRGHIHTCKVMAAAMGDLQACREQPGMRLKREADVRTAQRAERFGTSSAPSSPAVKKAKKRRHQK